MNYLVQFQINIVALFIPFSLYLLVRLSTIRTFSSRLLRLIILATAGSIVMEALTWIFDRTLSRGADLLEYSTNFILFLIGHVIGGLLLSYMDYWTFKNPRRVRQKFCYHQVSLLTFFLLVINIFNPIYFAVNPVTNSYSSGDYKHLHYIILAGFYINMLYFIVKNRKNTTLKESMIFIFCFLVPIRYFKVYQDLIVSNREFSFGYQKHEVGISLDELYNLADHKMYAHKQHGKNSPIAQNG